MQSFSLSGTNLSIEDDGVFLDVHIKSIRVQGSVDFSIDLTYRNYIKE